MIFFACQRAGGDVSVRAGLRDEAALCHDLFDEGQSVEHTREPDVRGALDQGADNLFLGQAHVEAGVDVQLQLGFGAEGGSVEIVTIVCS